MKSCLRCGALEARQNRKALADIAVGKEDERGNRITKVLWVGANYRIYVTETGLFTHLSDCAKLAEDQRKLCKLVNRRRPQINSLIESMKRGVPLLRKRIGIEYYHRELGRAIVEALQEEERVATGIVDTLIAQAQERVTNENRVRYLLACALVALGALAAGLVTEIALAQAGLLAQARAPYGAALIGGAFGALFSIAVRFQTLALVPHRDSVTNYVMGALRVLIGAMAGFVLLLALRSGLIGVMARDVTGEITWEKAGMLGFIAGFAERMVPNLLGVTGERMQQDGGADGGVSPRGGGARA